MADNQILPEAGYPSDFDEYPDSLVGYTTLKDTYGGNDIMVGGWGMSGSDSGDAVIMKEENNKFLRINCPTSSKSHMFTNSIDTPQKQIIFEQNIRLSLIHIYVLATAIAKSLARTVIKEVCGEDTDT